MMLECDYHEVRVDVTIEDARLGRVVEQATKHNNIGTSKQVLGSYVCTPNVVRGNGTII